MSSTPTTSAVNNLLPLLPTAQKTPRPELTKKVSSLIKFDDDEASTGNHGTHTADDFGESLVEDNDLLGISSNPVVTGANNAKTVSANADFFGLEHIQPEKPLSAMNAGAASSNNPNRGMSPMMGVSSNSNVGGGLAHHSPSNSMNNFQQMQQKQQQQQSRGVVRGGPMGGPVTGGGGGGGNNMNPMMGGGAYDPFNNIAGLNTQQQQRGGQAQQQQQSPYNNSSRPGSNNRSGSGGCGF
jgi:hypothetical protein